MICDIRKSGKSRSLYSAVEKRELEEVKRIMQHGINPAHWEFEEYNKPLDRALSALDLAINNDSDEIVDYLIQFHLDPYKLQSKYLASSLCFVIEIGKTKYLNLIFSQLENIMESSSCLNGAMYAAAQVDNVCAAKKLLDLNVDPNDNSDSDSGWTFLMEAALHNSINVSKLLVESGANPDFNAFPCSSEDSPIRIAVWNENWSIVKYLLQVISNKTDKSYARRNLNKFKNTSQGKKELKRTTTKIKKFLFPKEVLTENRIEIQQGLYYQDFIIGHGSSISGIGQRIVIRYQRLISSGRCLDSSPKRTVTLGTSFFGKGFFEGVFSMKIGGCRRLFISPELVQEGYGGVGIPKDDWAIIDVELLCIID
jgi:FKBP-type peptidyl-prolyl cis-trans isomerase